ncbi:MAG: DUF86 domain-containing protein [Chloroflexi bacterium]|nr:DUF86 domain-containing protein [Chloroflexota bacterium]MBI3763207.1 DUF86 domain-containing protein [Chloroflexota bacterium]
MPEHDDSVRLRDMLDHAREAVALAVSKSRADLDANRLLELSLLHLITIVGEAASRIPRDVQSQHDQVPWDQIVGMRNRIVHGYASINLDILWQTVVEDLPPLISDLEKIVPPEKSE